MNILLFTSYFPPDEHIGAARWKRLAKYLRGFGHDISVVAGDNGAASGPPVFCDRIRRVDQATGLPDRILRAVSAAKKGSRVEVSRQQYLTERGGSGMRSTGVLGWYVGAMGTLGKAARFPSVYWWSAGGMITSGMAAVAERRPDVIVATHPFPGCLNAASVVSAKTRIPWVADMRDGWSSYYGSEYPQGSVFYRGVVRLERRHLGRASRVVTVNALLGRTLKVSPDRVVVIPNSYDAEAAGAQDAPGWPEDKTTVFAFAGTILEEHYCDAFMAGLSAAMRQAGSSTVVVNYYGGSFGRLTAIGRAAGIPADRFVNHGYISKDLLRAELRRADVLVVFGFRGAYGATVTTGKVFDYIEAGRPILAVASRDSALASLVSTTGVGVVATDSAEVEEIVAACARNKAALLDEILSRRKQEALNEYSAVETARRYQDLLASLLTNTADAGGERRSP
jgi:glycosyltransferase involved in cell wall biosynthesis